MDFKSYYIFKKACITIFSDSIQKIEIVNRIADYWNFFRYI